MNAVTLAHTAPTPFVQQVGRALYGAGLLHEFATTIAYRPDHSVTEPPITFDKHVRQRQAERIEQHRQEWHLIDYCRSLIENSQNRLSGAGFLL